MEIGQPQGAARIREELRVCRGDFAPVIVVQPHLGQTREGVAKCCLAQQVAGGGGLAIDEEGLVEALHTFQRIQLGRGGQRLVGGDGDAVAGQRYGRGQQVGQGQATVFGDQRQRLGPAVDGAGHGQRRQRAACGQRARHTAFGIPFRRGKARRATAARNADGRLTGAVDHPETIAADPVHVGIGHGPGRGRGDHRLDRGAARVQDVASGQRRSAMRRADRAIVAHGRSQHVTIR